MMFRQQRIQILAEAAHSLRGPQACPSWTATYLPLDRKKRQSSTSTLAPEAVHSDVPRGKSISTQTNFFPQRNNATQYTAQEKPISELRDIIESSELSSFFAESGKIIEEALQQNETIDIFSAPLSGIGEEDISFGNKAENNMPELRTFTDLQYIRRSHLLELTNSNNSSIVAVPVENLSFAERVEQSGKARKAYVLVWNFRPHPPSDRAPVAVRVYCSLQPVQSEHHRRWLHQWPGFSGTCVKRCKSLRR